MLNISQDEIDYVKLDQCLSQFGLQEMYKKAQKFNVD